MHRPSLFMLLSAPLLLSANAAFALSFTHVPDAGPKQPGLTVPNVLSPELIEVVRAQGSMPFENPSASSGHYGYRADGPMIPAPGDIQTKTHNIEATKTEPDKNTYLVLHKQTGADPRYDYGTHFVFQGHETGGIGYITRINLDADVAHRVTLLAEKDVKGVALPNFDGSTWDPWASRLLFTAELGNKGGVWQSTLDGKVEDISGALGRGGYEGIQNDGDGNVWIVEDVGGATGTVNKNSRRPNSFIYRFVPKDRSDLNKGGKLQALAVMSKRHSGVMLFNSPAADTDIKSDDVKDLHTYGLSFDTKWLTIHDTDVQGNAPFDALALAKGNATPFKRPENGVFRPGTGFGEFYFTETGDTNILTQIGAEYGGFGGLFKLAQSDPSTDSGTLSLFYLSDPAHSGFDNITFLTKNDLIVVEDAGDTLHAQRKALDSGYVFDVRRDYSDSKRTPVRFLAQGRDPSATIDSGYLSIADIGFQNDGDNEITGIHVSDGDPRTVGILGAKVPKPFQKGWRVFYTQQHGNNVTYELLLNSCKQSGDEQESDQGNGG
jgi:hypothetical protein